MLVPVLHIGRGRRPVTDKLRVEATSSYLSILRWPACDYRLRSRPTP